VHGILRAISRRMLPRAWYKAAVGGMWEKMGTLQFDFLQAQGLTPGHCFLDVGCGSLRGGLHFVRYLDRGHYFGIDASADLLEAGRVELKRAGLEQKCPILVTMADFDLSLLHRTFDYALAQSVFTHLPLNSIMRCLANMEGALVEGGRFYATFFENPGGKLGLIPAIHHCEDCTLTTFYDRDPYHYDFGTFEFICQGTKLKAEQIGEWGHPRDQRMMAFVKKG
jgi:SAM-dependent methyltransferase